MENIKKYKEIVTDELLQNTLDNNNHIGFLQDYRVITCLLKTYKPKTLFETGTNVGFGINVMKTALPELEIYSLDLDYNTMILNPSQFPIGPNGEDRVGSSVKFPYIQFRGDSLAFDFDKYPCEAYFLDSAHDYEHPYHETYVITRLSPKLIIWHDVDILEVKQAIIDGLIGTEYKLFFVEDTRIAYAVKQTL